MHDGCNYFSFWAIFCPFTPLTARKINSLKTKKAPVEEENIKDYFIDDNDIFDSDEISESNRKFILDLIDRTSFIADMKRFVEDTEAKMKIVESAIKPEIEKKPAGIN